jgi:hypothetical protein
VPGEELRDELGLLLALVGQPVAGEPAVEDALRVVHLAVAEEVHEGLLSLGFGHFDASGAVAAAVARAACGRASAICSNAASSMAALTNQVSKALGGG